MRKKNEGYKEVHEVYVDPYRAAAVVMDKKDIKSDVVIKDS